MRQSVYLDNAATTKPKEEVIDAMLPYLYEKWHNPSSLYKDANIIKEDIDRARCIVGDFIGAKGNEIYFTSSGSESNCWAISGFVDNYIDRCPCVITTMIEHKSIEQCVKNLDLNRTKVFLIDVDKNGFVNIDELKDTISYAKRFSNDILVSIQFANNEVGTIQRVKEIASIAHKYGCVFHTDATQIFGAMPINVEELGIDMLSASGHKIGAPKGIGILYKRNGIDIKPIIYGSQMNGMRGGTENVPYIMGFAKAVELCDISEKNIDSMCEQRDYFIEQLETRFNCKLNGDRKRRLPNNISITFPQNVDGESLLYSLDVDGFQIGVGSACNSYSIEPSYVLKSIGLSNEEAMKTIRITLSKDIWYKDINDIIDEIDKFIRVTEIIERDAANGIQSI